MKKQKSDRFLELLDDNTKCHNCGKKVVKTEDKLVILATCNNEPRSLDELCVFHFQCWIDYFNLRVQNKARAIVGEMQTHAQKIMEHPLINSILRGSASGREIESIIKNPVDKNLNVIEIKKKIKEDHKKWKKKK